MTGGGMTDGGMTGGGMTALANTRDCRQTTGG